MNMDHRVRKYLID